VARVTGRGLRVRRGADRQKDQSYVLYMLREAVLGRVLLPVGELTKAEVRNKAAALGLRTAAKPDSQDVCFITTTGGRAAFLGARRALHPGVVVDERGLVVGEVDAVELVTVGQRRGLGTGGGEPRYAVAIDVPGRRVTVGDRAALASARVQLVDPVWAGAAPSGRVVAQCSAHGDPHPGRFEPSTGVLRWDQPQRRVAPGQSVVLYDPQTGDTVLGGGRAAQTPPTSVH
jgi:tRNA-specific 2-thiouridylase